VQIGPASAATKTAPYDAAECDTTATPPVPCEVRSPGAGPTGTATGSETSNATTGALHVDAAASALLLPVGAGPIAGSDSRSWARLIETEPVSGAGTLTVNTTTANVSSVQGCFSCGIPVLQTTLAQGYVTANATYFDALGDVVGADSGGSDITLNGTTVTATPTFSFAVPSGVASARVIVELGAITLARGGPGNNSSVNIDMTVSSIVFP
jgi:hypothetical protein